MVFKFLLWLFLVCAGMTPFNIWVGAPLWVTYAMASVALTLFVGFVGESRWFWFSRFMDGLDPERKWPI